MERILVKSYAKINLSLDVLGLLENGYHEVSMIMQQLQLADDVLVRWYDGNDAGDSMRGQETAEIAETAGACGARGKGVASEGNVEIGIEVSTNRKYLPTDERNIAYKAAKLMIEEYGGLLRAQDAKNGCGKGLRRGKVRIDIRKVIPVAAGLAGGSGNAAAVLHALNRLWKLDLSLARLCELGARLGADVPFCIVGQAYGNHFYPAGPQTSAGPASGLYPTSCALAYGTGTELLPLTPLNAWIVLSKPPISVSTAEIYKAFDSLTPEEIGKRPENERLAEQLKNKKVRGIEKNMANVLEKAAVKRYPLIVETEKAMKAAAGRAAVMMSGSGPTVFAILYSKSEALRVYGRLKKLNSETYITHTLITGRNTRNSRPQTKPSK